MRFAFYDEAGIGKAIETATRNVCLFPCNRRPLDSFRCSQDRTTAVQITSCFFSLLPSALVCSHRLLRRGRGLERLKSQVRQAIIVFHESPACMLTDRVDAPSGWAASFGQNKDSIPSILSKIAFPSLFPVEDDDGKP
ncbi:hypothetical protein JDV02_004384 [Purpureocillium takamizusanense]|uniref:Uncharacterized protein n=1 Tax=Purpureocillium takamizusanense TaxID=2060973 RepID=A0A9Q8VAS7_9HYPO|nr:uncharacterized protein JDV02_004384 [Purpureocillium takamizusanense]UNI18092.1 hypothetical protein JDV02_004384 [Purpureocillium takamizusanense]